MKPRPLQNAVYWLVLAFKRWLFTMRNTAFHAAFCDLLEKRWFMAELGPVLMKRLKALF